MRRGATYKVSRKWGLTTFPSERLIGCRSKPLQAKLSDPGIARMMNFSCSTIHREINRRKVTPFALSTSYQASVAEARSLADRRSGAGARCKLGADTNSPLWHTVLSGLRCNGRLGRSQANSRAWARLRSTELAGLLRMSHGARLPRASGTARKGGPATCRT
jgi:hypothetical protein